MNDYLLKDAAKILQINYSTAKTILRIFRIEKRVEKKNAEEERQLKIFLTNYKNKSTVESSQITQVQDQENNNKLIQIEKIVEELKSSVKNCYDTVALNHNMINLVYAYLFYNNSITGKEIPSFM